MSTLRQLIITPAELRAINDALAHQEAEIDGGDYGFLSPQQLSALRTANGRARLKVHRIMKPSDYR